MLPKFKVAIEAPDHVSRKQGKLPAVIRVDYTYGKPMNGRAVVKLYQFPHETALVEKDVDVVTGKGLVEFDIGDRGESELKIEANITEDFTGLKLSSNKTVKLHSKLFVVSAKSAGKHYTMGEPFDITVKYTPSLAQYRKFILFI